MQISGGKDRVSKVPSKRSPSTIKRWPEKGCNFHRVAGKKIRKTKMIFSGRLLVKTSKWLLAVKESAFRRSNCNT